MPDVRDGLPGVPASAGPARAADEPATRARRRIAGVRETVWFRAALAVIVVAVVDDAFVHPEPGTSAGDHLASGLVPAAIAVVAALAYPRLRPGLRGVAGLVCGVLADRGHRRRIPPRRRGLTRRRRPVMMISDTREVRLDLTAGARGARGDKLKPRPRGSGPLDAFTACVRAPVGADGRARGLAGGPADTHGRSLRAARPAATRGRRHARQSPAARLRPRSSGALRRSLTRAREEEGRARLVGGHVAYRHGARGGGPSPTGAVSLTGMRIGLRRQPRSATASARIPPPGTCHPCAEATIRRAPCSPVG